MQTNQIAWLGSGLMGSPMIYRLLHQNYHVKVWNRTRAKAEALQHNNLFIADNPDQAIETSKVIITMLSDAEAIRSTLDGIHLKHKTLIQMATIGPNESQQIAEDISTRGGYYLEAPVLGSIPEAQTGNLIIMAGGSESLFNQLKPLLSCFGPEPRLIGEIGHASALKLALNQLIGSLTVAFSTSLAFTQNHHVDTETFMEILRKSALYAPTFDKKLSKMLDNNYQNPNFPTEHLIKDLKLFNRESGEMNTDLINVLLNLYQHARQEHQREDYSCVYDAVHNS
ncbi:MAG: NAD(P)-dependent oxidoreductase [Gammaproteobacteria bacterium]|nr:NAD(P)-dependent oxidoreductase [Gammaproteobacteria bacterium]